LYKSCARQSGLKGAEVVSEIAQLPGGEIIVQEMGVTTEEIIVDPITVEQMSQEELHGATYRVSQVSWSVFWFDCDESLTCRCLNLNPGLFCFVFLSPLFHL
jgi:hypothetical protein